jgi:ubiquitin-conjugating enzyme E2 R
MSGESKMYRDDKDAYKKKVQEDLEISKKDIPAGFVMPTTDAYNAKKEEPIDFDDTWADSDEDFDFSGSDSDMDMEGAGSGDEDDD